MQKPGSTRPKSESDQDLCLNKTTAGMGGWLSLWPSPRSLGVTPEAPGPHPLPTPNCPPVTVLLPQGIVLGPPSPLLARPPTTIPPPQSCHWDPTLLCKITNRKTPKPKLLPTRPASSELSLSPALVLPSSLPGGPVGRGPFSGKLCSSPKAPHRPPARGPLLWRHQLEAWLLHAQFWPPAETEVLGPQCSAHHPSPALTGRQGPPVPQSHLHPFLLGLLQEKGVLASQGPLQRVCGGIMGWLLGASQCGLKGSLPPLLPIKTAPKHGQGKDGLSDPKGFWTPGKRAYGQVPKQKGAKGQGSALGKGKPKTLNSAEDHQIACQHLPQTLCSCAAPNL